jgi:DNA-binding LacI/PurR family transcriptional regulator
MVDAAQAAGYHLLPFPFRAGEALLEIYRELVEAGQVDGFVLSSVNYSDPRVAFLQARQVPFVAFGRTAAQPDHAYVDVDGAAGLRAATEYLIGQGHRRIGLLAWPEGSRVGDDRLAGYLAAMAGASLEVAPAWIARGEGHFEFGLAATHRWLALDGAERPTAIAALSDSAAVGALHALAAAGLTPGRDVAVIGFDDAPLAQFMSPPLSTLRQPLPAAGRQCVETLVGLIEGKPDVERQVLLRPELVLRGTA